MRCPRWPGRLAGLLALSLLAPAAARPAYPWLAGPVPERRIASIPPPAGYERVALPEGGFGAWLRGLPLRPAGTPVRLHDGREKAVQSSAHAVVDLDTGREDLQQCADAVIRLRAEYLWSIGDAARIAFHLTSGDLVPWTRWADGWRVAVAGATVSWHRPAAPASDRATFARYLHLVFTYAGSASLSREMAAVPARDVGPGDVLVQGGHPGHAVLVLDEARDAAGRRVLLLGQSYMPAQDFHVLADPAVPGLSPWFRAADLEGDGVRTPDWPSPFTAADARRFR